MRRIAFALLLAVAATGLCRAATEVGGFTSPLGVSQGGTSTTATPTNGQLHVGNGTNFTLAVPTAGIGLAWTTGSGTLKVDTAAADANGLGLDQVIQRSFSLAGNGADLTIYSSNAPFAFTIIDSQVSIATAQTAAVVTLRSATGGGGSALSDAFVASTTGVKRSATLTTLPTVALNGTLVVRASGEAAATAVVGNVIIHIQR